MIFPGNSERQLRFDARNIETVFAELERRAPTAKGPVVSKIWSYTPSSHKQNSPQKIYSRDS